MIIRNVSGRPQKVKAEDGINDFYVPHRGTYGRDVEHVLGMLRQKVGGRPKWVIYEFNDAQIRRGRKIHPTELRVLADAGIEVPPRARGVIPEEEAKAPAGLIEKDPPRRKRGRPRKNPLPEDVERGEVAAVQQGAAVSKG